MLKKLLNFFMITIISIIIVSPLFFLPCCIYTFFNRGDLVYITDNNKDIISNYSNMKLENVEKIEYITKILSRLDYLEITYKDKSVEKCEISNQDLENYCKSNGINIPKKLFLVTIFSILISVALAYKEGLM